MTINEKCNEVVSSRWTKMNSNRTEETTKKNDKK